MKSILLALSVVLLNSPAFAQFPSQTDYYLADAEAAYQQRQAQPIGTWLTQSGALQVEINACGNKLCGTINQDMTGNTDPVHSLKGKLLLQDLVASGDKQWRGTIYNRANGETLLCEIHYLNQNEIQVMPYKSGTEKGMVQIWKRVS